jgi:hypothetical protein
VFTSSVAAVFIFVLLPSADSLKGRLLLILVFVAAPVWVYGLVALSYALLYSSFGILDYFWRPFWRGSELRIMLSPSALSHLDLKLLSRGLFYFVPHAVLALGTVSMLPLMVIVVAAANNNRGPLGRPLDVAIYVACSLLTWLVVLPASYLVLFSSKTPTPDVLRLTVYRDLIKLFQDSDNLRFKEPRIVDAVRLEWGRVIKQLRRQEKKILATNSRSFDEYLRNRSEVFLEPLHRCLDDKNDAAALEALHTVARGRSLLTDQEIGKRTAQA